MSKFFLFFYLIFFQSITILANDECFKWFQESGLKPDKNGCFLNCQVLPIDMVTVHCLNECEKFCKLNSCQDDHFWKDTLKSGRPPNWDLKSEKSVPWTKEEKTALLSILNRLPEELKKFNFIGFYRMQKSIDLINPATTPESGKLIVIYDRTFNNPFWSTKEVILHELGHIVFLQLNESEKRTYKNQLGWKQTLTGDSSRTGNFVSTRSKESPEEDFAENFNYFLLDPANLKLKVPNAYKWFVNKFSSSFKLKEVCANEKK